MNGIDRLLLDTNAIVSLLRGELPVLQRIPSPQWSGISIISPLEFLSFPQLEERDRRLFERFLLQVAVVGLDAENASFIEYIINLRRRYRLKLPAAIIAATAVCHNAILITADRDFQSIPEISIQLF